MFKRFEVLFNTIKSVFLAALSNKKAVRCCALVLAVSIAVASSLIMAGSALCYNVTLDGQIVAAVDSRQVLKEALDIVDSRVEGSDVKSALGSTNCVVTFLAGDNLIDKELLADELIACSEKIVSACELVVDGKTIALGESVSLQKDLEAYKNRFDASDKESSSEFIEEVELRGGYFLKDELDSEKDIKSAIDTLNVKTVTNVVTDVVVQHKTVTKRTSTKVAGYKAVTTAGRNGVNRVTEQIVSVNGVETGRATVSSEVVSAPLNEIITVGTARSATAANVSKAAQSSGFIFPLPAGSWKVSSYYGDGRNHKGVDLCAPKGTAIYAVASGTVTKSTYHKGFGYYVEIDHGNGISTVYAHASTLCAKIGTRVSAGEVVALVGSTGNSTGNHLHFEVKAGGARVNPAPYIGL